MVIFYYNSQTASIVFVDTPVGSGYSYASTAAGFVLSDSKFANQTYNFIRTVSDNINKTPYILLYFFLTPLSFISVSTTAYVYLNFEILHAVVE